MPALRKAGLGLASVLVVCMTQTALSDPSKPETAAKAPDPMTTGALPASSSGDDKTVYPADQKPSNTSDSATSAQQPVAAKAPEPAQAAPASDSAKPAQSADKKNDQSAPSAATGNKSAADSKPIETKTEDKTAAAATAEPAKAEAPAVSAAAAPPPPPPADPVIEALRKKLADKSLATKDAFSQDLAAMADFYGTRAAPLWVHDGAFDSKGKAIIGELKKADDWGLESSDFQVGDLASGASADQQADAEARLTLMAMKYARFARGGRLDPVALSNILDMKPPVKDSKTTLAELSAASDPAAYLRDLNPKHEGFVKLREVLLKMRGPAPEEEAIDPALLVQLPNGKLLRPAAKSDEVALLRKRLKIAAASSDVEQTYDDDLVAAIKDVQKANGLRANGIINNRVRALLNAEGKPKKADPKREVDRILANMERWRWLPENLGNFYVMNNIPEYTSEIYKNGVRVLKQKMIVGQPSWPTPVLAADMTIVGMHPSWGMPPGIKMKELLPRVRAAGGSGFDFFDQLFGGGGSGAGAVIRAYKLQPYCFGRAVSPDSVTADNIRNCSFTQPPGPDNPLGIVKFRFPNRHDVYMHDTPERGLFAQSMRALSHGCMRVDQPKKTAEVILGVDKGWSAEKVEGLFSGSTEVQLDKPVPVYLVYFTARVDDGGHLQRYTDIYGHDDRVMTALRGRPVRYTAPEAVDEESDPGPTAAAPAGGSRATEISDAGSDSLDDTPPPAAKSKKKRNRQAERSTKRKPRSAGDILSDSFSGLMLN